MGSSKRLLKKTMKTYQLPYGVTITVDSNGVGELSGTYKEPALESLLLAHACAGVDIESPAYLEGLETALEAIANHTT